MSAMKSSAFFVGQIIKHLKVGYRGVIFSVDAEFSLSDEWYEKVARSRPPKDQPWYHVMVDGGTHTTYVAQRHLAASDDLSQIDHPGLGQAFSQFNGSSYLPSRTLH